MNFSMNKQMWMNKLFINNISRTKSVVLESEEQNGLIQKLPICCLLAKKTCHTKKDNNTT